MSSRRHYLLDPLITVAGLVVAACTGTVETGTGAFQGGTDVDAVADVVPTPADVEGGDELAGSDAETMGDSDRETGDPDDTPSATRLLLVHTTHGTYLDNWLATTGRDDFTLGPELTPFAPYRDRLLILDGFDGPTWQDRGVGAYAWGSACAFTGECYAPEAEAETISGNRHHQPARASLDWLLDSSKPLRSLVACFSQPMQTSPSLGEFGTYYVAASGRDAPRIPEDDPAALLAHLREAVASASPELVRLEAWFASADLTNPHTRMQAHAKVIATAFSLDVTRAAVFQATQLVESFDGNTLSGRAHAAYDNAAERAGFNAARAQIAQRVATLVTELDTTRIAGESMLEHTLVVWVDDTGFQDAPGSHTSQRLPIMWIGDLG